MLAVLPALKNPTISQLSDDRWVAMNTILEEIDRAQHHPASERSRRARHRGISAEQDCDVDAMHDSNLAIERGPISQIARRSPDTQVEDVVRPIIEAVRREGDAALLRYARQFDGLGDIALRISEDELAAAGNALTPQFARRPKPPSATFANLPKRSCRASVSKNFRRRPQARLDCSAADAVGCYVPSGRYPLPSTLLMTAVLAQTAGVPRICVTSPQPIDGNFGLRAPARVTEFYRVGGAQAIAAMAFGTETIPRVDRIVGPGNAYVAAAKKLLAGEVGIDFVAGPDRNSDPCRRWRRAA